MQTKKQHCRDCGAAVNVTQWTAATWQLVRAAQAACQSQGGTNPKACAEQHAADLRALAAALSAIYAERDARDLFAMREARAAFNGGPYRAEGREVVGEDWDSGPEAWHVIRSASDEWIAYAPEEHAAALVTLLNAGNTP